MPISLFEPLTENEACKILDLSPAKYRKVVAKGELNCTGVIREFPLRGEGFPTIMDILHYRLRACVQSEINLGIICDSDIGEILSEFIGRLEDGPPIQGGGIDPVGNLSLDSIWLLCRPPTKTASRKIAKTLARTFLRCLQFFGRYQSTENHENPIVSRPKNPLAGLRAA